MKKAIYFLSLIIIATGCFSSREVQKDKEKKTVGLQMDIVNKIDSAREVKKNEEKESEKQTEYKSETTTTECFDSTVSINHIPGAPKEVNDALAKNPIQTTVKGTRTTVKKENLKTNENEKVKTNEQLNTRVKTEDKKKVDSTASDLTVSKHKETKGMPWYIFLILGLVLAVIIYFVYRYVKSRIL